MATETAAALAAHFQLRVGAAPVLELLASSEAGVACFRYRCANAARANAQLVTALREFGYAMVSAEHVDGRPVIRCAFDTLATQVDVDAFVNASIVLGAIAANGSPVSAAFIGNLRQDGLPAYIGFAGLWRLELSGIEISTLGPLLEARLARDPDDACAMMDIATLLILTLIPENRAPAFAMQARALERQQVYRLPAGRTGGRIRVLAIAGPGDMTSITHLDCLLEASDVELVVLYARQGQPLPSTLPGHDLVFVAIGESAPNRPLLAQVDAYSKNLARRIFNRPDRILGLSRDRVSALLQSVAGVDMPMTASVGRDDLDRLARGDLTIDQLLHDGCFPLIVRPLDSQGGRDLARLDDPASVAAYLQATGDSAYFVSRFLDYRGADGLYRKYRVVLIEGRAFACHMAISTHWMIHYVNADMDESADKRAEEAGFMAGFDAGFALRHGPGLAQVDRLFGLDYYGIDCAETPEGRLLVFEADTAMLVHAMDRPDLYPYKLPQMEKLFAAFRQMLAKAVDA